MTAVRGPGTWRTSTPGGTHRRLVAFGGGADDQRHVGHPGECADQFGDVAVDARRVRDREPVGGDRDAHPHHRRQPTARPRRHLRSRDDGSLRCPGVTRGTTVVIRVAMDATPAIAGRTGIARYVLDLAAALPEQDVEPRLFAVGRASVAPPPGCRHLRIPARIIHRAWAAGLPPSAERIAGPVDVVHATSLLPPTTRRPVAMTVHDLDALDHAELHPDRSTRAIRALVRHLDRADVVLAVSRATADDLVQRGVERDRIVVTPNGRVELGAPLAVRVQDGPFVLAVGEQMPRKNLALLLHVWARAPELPALVHAGPFGSDTARLESLVDELGLAGRVRFLGYVEREVLARLLLDAQALCFPSIAEGFGLPVLEAMAAGLPVVASDLPVIREVTGGHACSCGRTTSTPGPMRSRVSSPTSPYGAGSSSRHVPRPRRTRGRAAPRSLRTRTARQRVTSRPIVSATGAAAARPSGSRRCPARRPPPA